MKKVKFITICVITCLASQGMYAQRHYAGVTAVECNYGLNTFGRNNTLLNMSVSQYKNRTTYLKIGLSYFEKSHHYNPSPDGIQSTAVYSTAKDFFINGDYFKTIATNMSSVYLNIGIGAFIGVESLRVPEKLPNERKYDFILGPDVKLEAEIFVLPRIALLAGITQYWSPFSDISNWNTVWNVGVKFLIY